MELLSNKLNFFFSITLLLIGSSLGEIEEKAKRSRVDLKIIGGLPTESHTYPFMVGIKTKIRDHSGWCGGALISPEFVITAAHCVLGVKEAKLHLGSHQLQNEGVQIRVFQNDFLLHSYWHPRYAAHDIALIHLPMRIVNSETVQPIELPNAAVIDLVTPGTALTAIGWGRTSRNFTIARPKTLEVIHLNVTPDEICAKLFPYYNDTLNICLDGNAKRTICRGDSGGPVFITDPHTGLHTLIGITSYGKKCDSVTVLTRVSSYIDWIMQRLKT